MNKKTFLILSSGLAVTALVGALSFAALSKASPLALKGNSPIPGTYWVALDAGNLIETDPEDALKKCFYTRQGNKINVEVAGSYTPYTQTTPVVGGLGRVDQSFVLTNVTPVSGLTSIEVYADDVVSVSYGFLDPSDDMVYSSPVDLAASPSGSSYDFAGKNPSFFKVATANAENSEIKIESIVLHYSCFAESYYGPATADEAFVFTDIGNNQYRVDGLATGYQNSTSLTIPATHNGGTVTEIGDQAFYSESGNPFLKKVFIPNTVTSIGQEAFYGCMALEKLVLSNTLQTIGPRAFYSAGAFASGDGLVISKIPASCVNLSSSAFEQAYATDFEVDEDNPVYFSRDGQILAYEYESGNQTYHNALLFYPGTRSGDLIIADDVEFVSRCGLNAIFAETIHFGRNVRKCQADAFYLCGSCQNFTVDANNPLFKGVDGILLNKAGDTLLAYPRGRTASSYSVPNGVTFIEEYAFYNNTHLTSVTLNSVHDISNDAFHLCTALVNIDLSNVSHLGSYAFKNCTKLVGHNDGVKNVISFNTGLETVPTEAFEGCAKIEHVELPDTLEIVSTSAFENCSSLESVAFSRDLQTIRSGAFKGCSSLDTLTFDAYNEDFTTIESEAFQNASLAFDFTIPATVTDIGASAFEGTSLTGITFPSLMTEIKTKVCLNCYELAQATIPGNIKTIRTRAFELTDTTHQGKLTNLYIADGVQTIEQAAFNNQYFNSVFIPSSVTTIGSHAFTVNNGSLLDNSSLTVYTDVPSPDEYQYRPAGWDPAFVSGSVTWHIVNGASR